MNNFKKRKGELVQEKKERAITKAFKKYLEKKCFWTWPFGHVWKKGEEFPGGEDDYCAVCGIMSPSDMA